MKSATKMDWRLMLGYMGLAMASVSSSVHADDQTRMASIQKGVQFHDQGNYKAALSVYQALLADHPADEMALYESAVTYMAMKDYPACIEYAGRSAAIKSQVQPQAIGIMASCQDDAGQLKAALKTFSKGVKQYPKDVYLNYNYAVTLIRDDDAKRAEKHLQVAIEEAPSYPSPYLTFASVRQSRGQIAISTLLFLRFIMIEPHSDRSVDVAKEAIKPFLPSDNAREITLNLGSMSGRNSEVYVMLDLMLGMARNLDVSENSQDTASTQSADASKSQTPADKTVSAMQLFFGLAQVDDLDAKERKALAKDFGWQTAQPLWTVLGEKDVLITFFYHVAAMAGVEGARENLLAHPAEMEKLNAVLTDWQRSLRR